MPAMPPTPPVPPLDPDLLAILVCPVPECRAALEQRAARLICQECGLQYRIENGWPVLIPEEAMPPAAPPQVSQQSPDARQPD